MTIADNAIERWADLELAPWRGFTLIGDALRVALRREAEAHQSVFLFHVDEGRVSFDDKSSGYDNPPEYHYRDALIVRVVQYREFLEAALSASGLTPSGTVAFKMEDLGQERFPVPVFAFQKQSGSDTILLPDVDFLNFSFYEAQEYSDCLPYDAKHAAAIFVGSTTGDPMLTADMVRALDNHRLRSAVYFKGRDNVTFALPNIVQVDTIETHAMILDLDVSGERRSWADQASHRYILSMDGNGATCSRVALALRSNAVLLKYSSRFLLYYFHGLEPWVHYIPIMRDDDVLHLLEQAPFHDPLHRDVAERSRDFADRYLTRQAVLDYTGVLLERYFSRFFAR